MMEVMISFLGCFKSAVVPPCELVRELQASVMVAAAFGQKRASPQGALCILVKRTSKMVG